MNALDGTSTRPYLIRALYEWCTDNGLTPYVAVAVDDTVQVPREYVKDGEIVLNISFDATSSLKLGNEFIEFKARFAGTAREIMVPISRVIAIYARENGQGMAFPMVSGAAVTSNSEAAPQGGASSVSPVSPVSLASSSTPASSTGSQQGNEGNVLQLVPADAGNHTDAADGTEQPDPPKPPSGPRPSLKRVK
ncbi:MAG: ClpXP protease specificity-enhancing factor [Comamonadaceae bacterium]|nr:MAG: ClpXP protease specificity-enhancing factor [Comamonadaceae bacterium]